MSGQLTAPPPGGMPCPHCGHCFRQGYVMDLYVAGDDGEPMLVHPWIDCAGCGKRLNFHYGYVDENGVAPWRLEAVEA